VHDADVLLTGSLHGARIAFCVVPSLGESERGTIKVSRTGASIFLSPSRARAR